jgi:hypothetical protein
VPDFVDAVGSRANILGPLQPRDADTGQEQHCGGNRRVRVVCRIGQGYYVNGQKDGR